MRERLMDSDSDNSVLADNIDSVSDKEGKRGRSGGSCRQCRALMTTKGHGRRQERGETRTRHGGNVPNPLPTAFRWHQFPSKNIRGRVGCRTCACAASGRRTVKHVKSEYIFQRNSGSARYVYSESKKAVSEKNPARRNSWESSLDPNDCLNMYGKCPALFMYEVGRTSLVFSFGGAFLRKFGGNTSCSRGKKNCCCDQSKHCLLLYMEEAVVL